MRWSRVAAVARATNSSAAARPQRLRRAMQYVPGSSEKMIRKAQGSSADSIAFDLEDSVSTGMKAEARRMVADVLEGDSLPRGERMVRINALSSPHAEEDLMTALKTRHIQALLLPKLSHQDDLAYVQSMIERYALPENRKAIKIVALVESAASIYNLREILHGGAWHGVLDGLVFGAEDYCADAGVERTPSRMELLYPRSALAMAARANGLQAIDMVCVDYKDPDSLREESEDGKRLGFTGKQAIHPAQVDVIQSAYSPSELHILRAARILHASALHDSQGKGAFELDGKMIDVPVVKQAEKTVALARSVGLTIPHFGE